MAKYLVLWELDPARIPIDPKERAAGWAGLMAMVRQDIEKGITKDWGTFVGEAKGFYIAEGTELDIALANQQYMPFASFKVYPVGTVDLTNEMIKTLAG